MAETAIEKLEALINKEFGANSMFCPKVKMPIFKVPRMTTGNLFLDMDLGGGLALGKIHLITGPFSSGKSYLCLKTAAEFTRRGMKVAFIDAEFTFDPSWAEACGVDMGMLFLIRKQVQEEVIDIVELLVASGEFGLIIIDSLAALIPADIREDAAEKHHMGKEAKLNNKMFKKLVAQQSEASLVDDKVVSTVIVINQWREKVGLTFGCFHYDTLVNFVDGRSIPIGVVVDEKIKGEVWSFDEAKNRFFPKKITAWHDNGVTDTFVHFKTDSVSSRGGNFGFAVTPNHELLTEEGWKVAGSLSTKDRLVTKYESTLNNTLGDFMTGVFVGDSNILAKGTSSAEIRLQDSENPEYINWKLGKLEKAYNFTERVSRGRKYFVSEPRFEFLKVKEELGKRDPLYLLSRYSDLSFAVWIMDDGHYDCSVGHSRYILSVKRYKGDTPKLRAIESALERVGLPCRLNLNAGVFSFSKEVSDKIALRICKFVPPCMEYKLPLKFKGMYKDFELDFNKQYLKTEVGIKEIRINPKRVMRSKRKFDLTIQGTENYLVGGITNGIVAHNSPATLPGGKGQYYYSSTWIDFWADKTILDSQDKVVGMYFGYNIKKNKTSPPRRTGQVAMYLEKYKGMAKGDWDAFAAIIDLAVLTGVFTKSGTWYGGPVLGKSLQYSKLWKALYDDEDLEIKVVEAIGVAVPEIEFNHLAFQRKKAADHVEGLLEGEEDGESAEVDAEKDAGGDSEGEEPKAGEKRGKKV